MKEVAKAESQQHRSADAQRGVEKSGTSREQYFAEVHAETQGYHSGLQKEFRQSFTLCRKRVMHGEAINQATKQCDGRGHQSPRRQDKSQEEQILRHSLGSHLQN